jgi:TRAP-type C4-dicarboxylate transport system permease small subunit
MKIVRILRNIFDRTMNLMYVFAGILLIYCMLSISIGVASRYLFDRPLGWVIEIVEYSLLYIAFLVAPLVLKREAHIRMDLVFDRLGPRVQFVLSIITSSISTIICFILFWFGVRVTRELFRTHYTTPTILEIPKFIVVAIIFIGSAVLFLQFLIRTFGILSSRKASQSEKEEHGLSHKSEA